MSGSGASNNPVDPTLYMQDQHQSALISQAQAGPSTSQLQSGIVDMQAFKSASADVGDTRESVHCHAVNTSDQSAMDEIAQSQLNVQMQNMPAVKQEPY